MNPPAVPTDAAASPIDRNRMPAERGDYYVARLEYIPIRISAELHTASWPIPVHIPSVTYWICTGTGHVTIWNSTEFALERNAHAVPTEALRKT